MASLLFDNDLIRHCVLYNVALGHSSIDFSHIISRFWPWRLLCSEKMWGGFKPLLPGGRKFCKITVRAAKNIFWPRYFGGRTVPNFVQNWQERPPENIGYYV